MPNRDEPEESSRGDEADDFIEPVTSSLTSGADAAAPNGAAAPARRPIVPRERGAVPSFPMDEPLRLDREWITVERLSEILSAVVMTIILALGFSIFLAIESFQHELTPYLVVGLTLALVHLWSRPFYWPKLAWRHISWRVDDTGIEISRGVFNRSRIILPKSRIQHTDVNQGPIQRQWRLATFAAHTAGTGNDTIELDGLRLEVAEELRDWLIAGTGGE